MLQNPSFNQSSNDSNDENDAMSLLSTFMLQGWVNNKNSFCLLLDKYKAIFFKFILT